MQITFEPGDIVEVMDDSNAGDFAGCVIKLISKEGVMWKVEFESCVTSISTDKYFDTINEAFFIP
jgi:hypothetical protein